LAKSGEKEGKETKTGKEAKESKETKKEKAKKPKPETSRDKGQEKEDFKYIVRLASTDLDGKRRLVDALSDIRGIGYRTAILVADKVGLPRYEKIGNFDDTQIEKIENAINTISEYAPPWLLNRQNDWETGEDYQIFGPDLQVKIRDDINLMKKIRCYKGIRHEQGQKVRGQRTRSNGRTGLTIGVTRKGGQKGGQQQQASK